LGDPLQPEDSTTMWPFQKKKIPSPFPFVTYLVVDKANEASKAISKLIHRPEADAALLFEFTIYFSAIAVSELAQKYTAYESEQIDRLIAGIQVGLDILSSTEFTH